MADYAIKARNAQGNIVAETSVKRVARRRYTFDGAALEVWSSSGESIRLAFGIP